MLIDNKGREFNPKNLPANKGQREAVLAGLREVLVPRHTHREMFSLQARAVLK